MSKLTAMTDLTSSRHSTASPLVGTVLTVWLCKQAIYHPLYGWVSVDAYLLFAAKVAMESHGNESDAAGNGVMM